MFSCVFVMLSLSSCVLLSLWKVRLVLEEPEPGVTVVKLTQTDVSEEDRYGNSTVVENTERGWTSIGLQYE
ncbi:hypothetical protein L6452_34332 [Arctium lappa]|uniref:Uncharacterized protein n=1 Tax=Arctium lappa TaxID=4217 RepID=A0ACB8YIH3_ARCLA|nr:hypothetical protein L6452_34332 [Arctium lappa]